MMRVLLASVLALATPRTTTHVACLGDSITASYGASSEAAGYPARLAAALPGVEVRAFGAPSTTAASYGPDPYAASQPYADAGAWLSALPPSAAVDLVVLLGTNDAVSVAFDAGSFATDYAALLEHFEALAPHPRSFVVLPPPMFWNDLVHTSEAPALLALGRVTVDAYAAFAGAPWLTTSDGVHPDDQGHDELARLVRDAMTEDSTP